MSTVLILTPIIISSWPAISAAVGSAAAALGLALRESIRDERLAKTSPSAQVDSKAVTLELADSQVAAEAVAQDREIVLTRGAITLTVRRNAKGRFEVCAAGAGHSEMELEAVAREFSQKMAQCLVYNKVLTELRAKGFQVVEEEQMEDEAIRIHVRRWEG